MSRLTAWVVHESNYPLLPRPEQLLGTVAAHSRERAEQLARNQFPGKQLVIQPEGAVITSDHAPRKKRAPFYGTHGNRRRDDRL